jgi:hypothetical protein
MSLFGSDWGNSVNCGSGLAREGGLSFKINIDWPAAFASKPAPTGDFCCLLDSAKPGQMPGFFVFGNRADKKEPQSSLMGRK